MQNHRQIRNELFKGFYDTLWKHKSSIYYYTSSSRLRYLNTGHISLILMRLFYIFMKKKFDNDVELMCPPTKLLVTTML